MWLCGSIDIHTSYRYLNTYTTFVVVVVVVTAIGRSLRVISVLSH